MSDISLPPWYLCEYLYRHWFYTLRSYWSFNKLMDFSMYPDHLARWCMRLLSPLKVCDMASSTWQFYESKFLVPPYSGPVTRITFQLLIESCTSIFVGYQDCSQPPIFMHPLYIGIKMSVCLYIRNRQKLMMCIYCCGSLVVYSSRTAMALCMPLMSQPHINVA